MRFPDKWSAEIPSRRIGSRWIFRVHDSTFAIPRTDFGSGKMAAVAPLEARCVAKRAQEAACETERAKVTHRAAPAPLRRCCAPPAAAA